jgi:hypothetical protein
MGIITMCGTKVALRGRPVAQQLGRGGSGPPRSRAVRRGALCRHDWPTIAQKQKSPPRQCRAGLEGKRQVLDATG